MLAPASLLLTIEAALSLRWRLGHDTSIVLYVTYLIQQHGYAPYRDVFDFSLPGTLAFNYIIVKLFGYGNLGLMVFNLIWTGALLAVTWMIMRRFGWWVAWGSVVLFGVFYLQAGRPMALQRDYVLLLPLSLAVWTFLSRSPGSLTRAALVGLLIGVAATLKPHALIALPVVMAVELLELRRDSYLAQFQLLSRRSLAMVGSYIGGAVIPLAAAILWIWSVGSLPSFIEMFREYIPLHTNINYFHRTILGWSGQFTW
ncbi:MAG: hypothetical protein IIB31_08710 [Chloroflexi bacterium]|nr:hypothetical protein [Chloroflexota bacterium]